MLAFIQGQALLIREQHLAFGEEDNKRLRIWLGPGQFHAYNAARLKQLPGKVQCMLQSRSVRLILSKN